MLSAFSYMELSSRLPGAGSTYAFVYHTLGELPAVVGAGCLTFEYGISGAGVARSWSDKFVTLIGECTPANGCTAWFSYYLPNSKWDSDIGADYLGAILQFLCVAVCFVGASFGNKVIKCVSVGVWWVGGGQPCTDHVRITVGSRIGSQVS